MSRFGDYEVSYVTEGRCRLDGGAMFGVVPKTIWSRSMTSDDKNRIEIAMNCLVVKGHSRIIVVDTGCGDKWDEKSRAIYGIETAEGGLAGVLRRAGVDVDEVTDVVYTHLHFDHSGGGTVSNGEGMAVPLFPKAVHHVQKRQWEWAASPSERDRASYFPENLEPLEKSGRLNIIDGDRELFPGFRVFQGDDHTVGHQTIMIGDGGAGTLYHCGDLVPTSRHVRLPYVMAYDLFPLATLEKKKAVLSEAADKGWVLFFEHCTKSPACRIGRTKRGFEAGEPVALG